jgi:PAS domain S-box-containing protein
LTVSERLETGLETLRGRTFDLVLLDLGLPDSQGLDTFQRLHEEFPSMPVVVLSGLMDERMALEAVQAGAQDYLVKGPVSWEIAPRAIRYAIERQQSQSELRESEERYRLFFNTSIDAVFVTVPTDGSILAANPAACQMFGQTEEEFYRLGRNGLVDLSDPRLESALEERARTGRFIGELNFIRKDGTKFPGEISSNLYKNKDGHERASLIIRDITERKQAEEKLGQSETRYRLATNATNDVIWEWNAKSHQLLWTENAQFVFSYTPEEIGPNEKWWDEHLHPDDREHVLEKLNTLLAGDGSIWSEEYRLLLKDGSYAYISDHAYVERDANGEPVRMIGAMSNITERRRSEEKIQRQLEELQRWYDLTIDRETRILELKHEVNDLLRRLQEPPRYPSAE